MTEMHETAGLYTGSPRLFTRRIFRPVDLLLTILAVTAMRRAQWLIMQKVQKQRVWTVADCNEPAVLYPSVRTAQAARRVMGVSSDSFQRLLCLTMPGLPHVRHCTCSDADSKLDCGYSCALATSWFLHALPRLQSVVYYRCVLGMTW